MSTKIIICSAILFLTASYDARAGFDRWTPGGVPVSPVTYEVNFFKIVPDLEGGAYFAWMEITAKRVYVQHVTRDGMVAWATPMFVTSAAVFNSGACALAPDGAGGLFVVWEEDRGGGNSDIYAQRVNPAGTPLWPGKGTIVCSATDTQSGPAVVPDGAGGVIIAWEDFRAGFHRRVYVQRLDAGGAALWTPEGVFVDGDLNDDDRWVRMAPDGEGGAIITWKRESAGTLLAQRVTRDGLLPWGSSAVTLCSGGLISSLYQISVDPSGGATVAYAAEGGFYGRDIGVAHILSSGVRDWGTTYTRSGTQTAPGAAPGSASGTVVVWQDESNSKVYVQKVINGRYNTWSPGSSGKEVSMLSGTHVNPVVAPCIGTGFMVGWTLTSGSSGQGVYAQALGANGEKLLGEGKMLSSYVGRSLAAICDNTGGTIFAWVDERSFTPRIYAQRMVVDSITTAEVTSDGGGALSLPTEYGTAAVEIPAGAFAENVNVVLTTATPDATGQDGIRTIGPGVDVRTSKPVQPAREVTITLSYRDEDAAGYAENRFVLARYEPAAGRWLPLPSTVSASLNRVSGRTAHLSRFGIIELSGAPTLSSVNVFPNPFDPKRATGLLTIENLTASAAVTIYTMDGEQVRTLNDEGGIGRVYWDGKNKDGSYVASGIYVAMIEGGGQKRSVKIAVEK